MAASPANIMRRIGATIAADTGTATLRQIRRTFVNAGYGPSKIEKWIDLFTKEEMITPVGKNDDGEMMYKSVWWV